MTDYPVPTNYTVWTSRGSPSYRSGEGHLVYAGRLLNTPGRIPVVFCHGFLLSIAQMYEPATSIRRKAYLDDFQAIAGGATNPVVAADLAGPSTWGNDSVVATGGAIDDLLAWANNPATAPDAVVTGGPVFGTRTDKVALFAESMGCLNALNWAWRNPGKVAAIVLRAPVVALDAFHDRNSGTFGAIIEAAYGGAPGYEAALATHDPMLNLDLIRPFGHRIQLWAGTSDEFIPPSEAQAFAELVGAEYHEIPGTHADLVNTPPDEVGFFFLETIRSKQHTFVQWEPTDWGRLEEVPITIVTGGPNTYDKSTIIGERGRRGSYAVTSGVDGNDRRVHLFPTSEFSAVDMEVYSVWYSGDTLMAGQQGHAMRSFIDYDAGTYRIGMVWQNIIFAVPWIINLAVWTGPIGGPEGSMTQNGAINGTLEGLRIASGGQVLASSRSGNVATYQVAQPHRVLVGDLLYIQDMETPSFDATGFAITTSPTSFSISQAGPDVISGGTGTFGNGSRTFPYQVRSRVYDLSPTIMEVKAWPFGVDEPAYGDPLWSLTWTDPATHAHRGYGQAGILNAHVHPGTGGRITWGGPVMATEL